MGNKYPQPSRVLSCDARLNHSFPLPSGQSLLHAPTMPEPITMGFQRLDTGSLPRHHRNVGLQTQDHPGTNGAGYSLFPYESHQAFRII